MLSLGARFLAVPAIGWSWAVSRLLILCTATAASAVIRAGSWRHAHLQIGDVSFLVVVIVLAGAVVFSRRGAIREAASTVLVPPLPAGRWVVAEGETKAFNHHWPAPRQRAALDLVRVQRVGDALTGTSSSWGQVVRAPASGQVVEAVDGVEDGQPPRGQAAGNHVSIQTPGGERILLAHLQNGSLRVREGQIVRAGDEVGLLGNSGNSSEPHLHLHIVAPDGRPLRARFIDDPGPFRRGDVIRFRSPAPRAAETAECDPWQ